MKKLRPATCVGLTLAAVVAAILIWFVMVLGLIQWRLTRNGQIVNDLVEALRERYPGPAFNGAALYEKEVVYVHVQGMPDLEARAELEQWLAAHKRERGIQVEIWLRYIQVPHDLEVKL